MPFHESLASEDKGKDKWMKYNLRRKEPKLKTNHYETKYDPARYQPIMALVERRSVRFGSTSGWTSLSFCPNFFPYLLLFTFPSRVPIFGHRGRLRRLEDWREVLADARESWECIILSFSFSLSLLLWFTVWPPLIGSGFSSSSFLERTN